VAAAPAKVVVASTIALSFISFWRAAAIVLSDLASSAYYVGGIAEQAIGKAAPWFILGIMLFSYAVRAVYIESCSMFVRGGVYRVVHESLGPVTAKLSVSALMFDYVLTGPISAVSAGLYLGGLVNEVSEWLGHGGHVVDPALFAVMFALGATVYFWRKNVIGIQESSQKALRIMQITTVMVVMLIAWCLYTVLAKGFQAVPLPVPGSFRPSSEALGWLDGTFLSSIPAIVILVGLGHSLLAMSGEESLAQVNREIAHPKLKNLERAGLVIFIYSMVFTSLVSFFAVMLIPDAERPHFFDNLIGGLAMHLAGPMPLRLLFHAFVVVVGTLILSGAVNTALIGSNGVLNRVAEDGVMPAWFRHPHHKFGTTSRIIHMMAMLQVATILLSRGNVFWLGEAYAFGVVWSFAFKALSVTVLRYKQPGAREWKVPGNFTVAGREIPLGLVLITLVLFALAGINVVTKRIATTSGLTFTVIFFTIFQLSEWWNKRRLQSATDAHEKFRLDSHDEISSEALGVRPGNVLVAVRNPSSLVHLKRALEKTDTRKMDVVAVSVRKLVGEETEQTANLFAERQSELFSHVVSVAEKAGKTVTLLVVPGSDPELALVGTAARLGSSRIVLGSSPKMDVSAQGLSLGKRWELLPEPRPPLSLEIVPEGEEKSVFFNLGPHPPRLWPEDLDRLHRLWLELSGEGPGAKLHHRDVVGLALERLERDLSGAERDAVVGEARRAASN
jgi:hypothetical protein